VFEGRALAVELERDAERLVGQLVPATPGQVTLLGPDGELGRCDVDEWGRFRFERLVSGPTRLRCTTAAGVLVTEWVRL
jgi:hypothetical protein